MKYTLNGTTYNVSKAEVERNMKTLGVSEAEAVQIYLEDEGILENEVQTALEAKAKAEPPKSKQHTFDPKKPRKPREKKIDTDKIDLVKFLAEALGNKVSALQIVNEQKEISFEYNGASYSVNLTKHRPPKE